MDLSKVLKNSDAWREAQNVYLRGGNEAELKERSQQMVQWKQTGNFWPSCATIRGERKYKP